MALNTSAGVWGASTKTQAIPELNATMQSAYGSANFTAGRMVLTLHAVLDSAASATKAVADANSKLDAGRNALKSAASWDGALRFGKKVDGESSGTDG